MRGQMVLLFCIFAMTRSSIKLDIAPGEWESFKLTYNKEYDSDVEDRTRKEIFAENSRKIAEHNDLYENGVESFTMAMNKFGDISDDEFLHGLTMHGLNFTEDGLDDDQGATFIGPRFSRVPKYIDWRRQGAVTKVKYQGLCGSCWAFSATGALEGQHFRKTHRLVSLSEQNLIDCSSSFGTRGCMGGWPKDAFLYIKNNKGIDTEKSYPYTANQGARCGYNKKYSGASDKGYITIPKSEYKLKKAVATKGPVSIVVDSRRMRFYKSGLYYDKYCSNRKERLNHAMLVVGYGTHGGDYWLIKNSWGTGWGLKGYMKLARNRKNHCGVTTAATELSAKLVEVSGDLKAGSYLCQRISLAIQRGNADASHLGSHTTDGAK